MHHCITSLYRFSRKYTLRAINYGVMSFSLLFVVCWWVLPWLTPNNLSVDRETQQSQIILDRNGEILHHFTRSDFVRHRTLDLSAIPSDLQLATLAAEDKRFWQHGGVDPLATARALKDALTEGHFVGGASTITQQTVKLTSPKQSRSLKTKILEALQARRLEMTMSKEDILETYFNHLEYGNRSQGPYQAADHYFNKPLEQLSLAESALLAGLPQAPTRHNPRKHLTSAIERRDWILDRMAMLYDIPQERIQRAKAEPVQLSPLHDTIEPHYLTQLIENSSNDIVQTTIDKKLQQQVTTIAETEVEALKEKNVNNAAVVVIHNPTGEVLCLVGSQDSDSAPGSRYNAALLPRSPGSALKPFVFLQAFENSHFTPASIIPDIPTSYASEIGMETIVNYDRQHHGPVTTAHALGNSLNIPTVRLLDDSGGAKALLPFLQTFGFSTLDKPWTEYGLGLAIGGGEVSLLELTNAYATLARGGRFLHPTFQAIPQNNTSTRVASAHSTLLISHILSDNQLRSGTFGAHSHLRLPFRCAVKTGTSTDYRDNMCIGYTEEFTVGVWVGNIDHSPMKSVSGVTGAGPIFHQTMLALHKNHSPTWMQTPIQLKSYAIDPHTGKQLDSDHPRYPLAQHLTLAAKPAPSTPTDYASNAQLKPLLDDRYKDWISDRQASFTLNNNAIQNSPIEPLRILHPIQNATYFLDPDLPNNGKILNLKSNLSHIQWSCDTLEISNQSAQLTPGEHQITALCTNTNSSKVVSICVEEH